MAQWPVTAFTPQQFHLPTPDGDYIEFTGAFSEWDIYKSHFGNFHDGEDVSVAYELMEAAEEERNKELDRKIRIIGEALNAIENAPSCQADWYSRSDSWTRILPSDRDKCGWPLHRVWAHFMLWPLDKEIQSTLVEAEFDSDYEKWLNSKQYVKSLEEYNFHKLLAFEKGESPHWVGEFTGDNATSLAITGHRKRAILYKTSFKDRFKVDAIIRTEFPNQWGAPARGYAKASSPFGDIYIPNKFRGYIGQPGAPQAMTVALQDVGGDGRKGNGFRWTCIFTH